MTFSNVQIRVASLIIPIAERMRVFVYYSIYTSDPGVPLSTLGMLEGMVSRDWSFLGPPVHLRREDVQSAAHPATRVFRLTIGSLFFLLTATLFINACYLLPLFTFRQF